MDLVVDGNDTVPSRQGSPCPCVSVVVVGSVGVCSCVCDAHVHMMEDGGVRLCTSVQVHSGTALGCVEGLRAMGGRQNRSG
eukprot:scaffold139836_cov20-Tisochrysis_lutea.AAC.1